MGLEDDEDPDDVPWPVKNGNAKRVTAKRKFNKAVLVEELAPVEAEEAGREALAEAASALYWLEDSEFEETAHDELHKYGRYVREHFRSGCKLHWDGSQYQQVCPVAIAHKRFGFSIGFVGNRLCSICSEDASECAHMPGKKYEVAGGPNPGGYCVVCHDKDCTTHSESKTYTVRASVQITDGEIFEVSLVSKPVSPDARLTALPIPVEGLKEALGPEFEVGMRVNCDRCLSPCDGFDTLPSEGYHPDSADLL